MTCATSVVSFGLISRLSTPIPTHLLQLLPLLLFVALLAILSSSREFIDRFGGFGLGHWLCIRSMCPVDRRRCAL